MAETIQTAIYRMGVEGTATVEAAAASVDRLSVSQEKMTRATRTSADSVDRLLGKLDPRIRAEQQLQAALAQVNRFEEEGIGTAALRGQAIAAATERYNASIQKLKGANAEGTFLGAGNAAKLSAFQIQNLSFQAQDMFQAFATGQPAFRTIIQQGSQIAQIFGPGVGVAGALKAVGAGLLTFVTNPLNLAVVAFAAAGGAAALFYQALSGAGGESAEDALKRHKDLIDDIAKAYGESASAARAFGSLEGEMLNSAALRARIQLTDDLKKSLESLTEASTLRTVASSGIPIVSALAGVAQTAIEMKEALDNIHIPRGFLDDAQRFRESIVTGTADVVAYRKQLDQLGQDFPTSENLAFIDSEMKATQASYELDLAQQKLEATMRLAAGAATAEDNALLGIAGTIGRVIQMSDALRESFAGAFGAATARPGLAGSGGAMTDALKARFGDAFEPVKVAEEAAKKAAAIGKQQSDAINKVNTSLRFQMDQLGRTAREQAIYNQLNSAGVTINSAAGQKIAEAAGALFDQQAALKSSIDSMDTFRKAAGDMLGTFVSGLREGKSAADALGDAINNLADKLFDMALNDVISGLFGKTGTPGGGILSGFLGGGGVSSVGAGLYHDGGVAGSPTATRYVHPAYFDDAPRYHRGGIAGLRAGEVAAILQRGERVIPRGGGGGGPVVNVIVNSPPGMEVTQQEERSRSDGGVDLELTIDRVNTKNMLRPGTGTSRAGRASGLQPPLIRR